MLSLDEAVGRFLETGDVQPVIEAYTVATHAAPGRSSVPLSATEVQNLTGVHLGPKTEIVSGQGRCFTRHANVWYEVQP